MSALKTTDLFVIQRPVNGDTSGGDDRGTYKLTGEQLSQFLNAQDAVFFKGTANFTDVDEAPKDPQNGDLWVNDDETNGGGLFNWGNHDPSGGTVVLNDKAIYATSGFGADGSEPGWYIIGGSTASGTLTGITAGDGIEVNNDQPATPQVSLRPAQLTSTAVGGTDQPPSRFGGVDAIAIATDVAADKSNPSPNPTAVVTAELLKATNDALSAATAGGVTDVNGVNPKDADIPDQWKDSADTSTYQKKESDGSITPKPAINVYDESNNVKDVYVKFATENQVGVSYIAEADTGAIMDFSGAERFKPDDANGDDDPVVLGGNLDNHGMMTTRRTYNNFVPRDFDLLNPLPTD